MIRRLSAIVLVLAILLIPGWASAQGNRGQGLEISPPLLQVDTDPGKTVKLEVRVRNVTQEPLLVKIQTNDFTAGGEDGNPKLLLEAGEQSPYSLKEWINTITEVTLNPGEQKPITIILDVPIDASPGGHYGVVRFTGTPPGLEDSGVSLSASIGALMLVKVSGNIQEQAKIAELYAQNQKGQKRSLFEYGPLDLITRIQNTGNVHVKPSGTIRVTNLYGREVQSLNFNQSGGNVLPASTRKFSNILDKKLLLGRYKMQADIVYGAESTIISGSTYFWVIPYKLILIALALIALLVFAIKRYNKYIVKKASKNKNGKNKTSKNP